MANSLAWISTGGGAAWTPLSEASLQAWWDASVNTNLLNGSAVPPSSGDQVASWSDLSTNGRTATGAGSSKPTWITSVQNSLGVTRYAGADENFVATALGPVFAVNDGPITFGAVMKFSDVSSSHTFINFWGSGGQIIQVGERGDTTQYDFLRFDGSISGRDSAGTADTSFHTFIGICTGTTVTLYVDGAQIGSANVNVDTATLDQLNNFGIGRNAGGGGTMNGDLGELQIYNSSSPTLSNIQTYLKAKWNTP